MRNWDLTDSTNKHWNSAIKHWDLTIRNDGFEHIYKTDINSETYWTASLRGLLVHREANQSRSGTILSVLVVQTCWEICSVKLTKHLIEVVVVVETILLETYFRKTWHVRIVRTTRERVRPFLCRRPAVRRKPLNKC